MFLTRWLLSSSLTSSLFCKHSWKGRGTRREYRSEAVEASALPRRLLQSGREVLEAGGGEREGCKASPWEEATWWALDWALGHPVWTLPLPSWASLNKALHPPEPVASLTWEEGTVNLRVAVNEARTRRVGSPR